MIVFIYHTIMQLFEPQRWVSLLQSMNTVVSSSHLVFSLTSFVADAVVLLFPVLLIIVYIIWIKYNNNTRKEYALRIFSSTVVAAVLNIIIQFFFEKARPETVLEWTQRLILKHLPTMSFPSDHAAVGMAFWYATYLFASLLHKKESSVHMRLIWVFFIVAWIAMSLARVWVWIHWPTDILAGWVVWILSAISVSYIPQQFYNWVISIEKKIFSLFYKK